MGFATIESEPDYALLEEVWGITPSPKKHTQKTAKRKPETEEEIEIPPDTSMVVHIQDEELIKHLDMYKEEYRNKIVESMLLKYLHRKEECTDQKVMYQSLKEKLSEILSDSNVTETIFLLVWITIAVLLFFLVIRGSS